MEDSKNHQIPNLNTGALGIQGGGGLGLNFNVPDLSINKYHGDEQDEDEPQKFSWKNEIEQIDSSMVNFRAVEQEIDQHTCTAKLETLENEYFLLTCSVAKGIRVTETNRPNFDSSKAFESLESLLMKVSPMYIKAFTSGNY